jgi:DNA-binding transcriptional MerR regulator
MLKPSAILNDDEFMGTAEELADFVSNKLVELGFGAQHNTSERLVRFYVYQGIISKADRALDDRRKANFGPTQVRQLLLARLLSERGWDLDRIKSLLIDNSSAHKLNSLIDSLATPTEAEKLLFKTKSSSFDKFKDFKPAPNRSLRPSRSSMIGETHVDYSIGSDSSIESDYSPRKFSPSREAQKIRDVSEARSPADALKIFVKKELMRDDLSPQAKELFLQLLAFNPTVRGDEPKRERWSRLRLNHWCEIHLNIDGKPSLKESEINQLVEKFRNSLI